MTYAGCRDPEFALSLARYLATVSDDQGLVPFHFENAFQTSIAPHWVTPTISFGVNPTAEICGFLHFQGIQHDWLSLATETCYRIFMNEPPEEAHALACAARLAEHVPDRTMAANLLDMLAVRLPKARFFQSETPVSEYGLTPLTFAPQPDSLCRQLFSQNQLEAHLHELAGQQQLDGGWPITWTPPCEAAKWEWRGRITLDAVSTLSAYAYWV